MSTIFDVKFFDEIEDFFLTKMPRHKRFQKLFCCICQLNSK